MCPLFGLLGCEGLFSVYFRPARVGGFLHIVHFSLFWYAARRVRNGCFVQWYVAVWNLQDCPPCMKVLGALRYSMSITWVRSRHAVKPRAVQPVVILTPEGCL